ncbi:aminofutalosine synthase MqnE [Desulfovermiculus halophilus]|jgi:aminodeoxyfutalosine synthase|uniref:aminofutalosine synthase MqnE n=1 Tax=Desulfovermiculus halophilus TaxID=339722 RepID=UPI00054F502D|nr:aminofutalosine synthase MqnE [Desulfovermiculus halophilus]
MPLHQALRQHNLSTIADKVRAGERLTLDEGQALFDCPDPVLVGALAHAARTERHGLGTSYVLNQQINYTNICVNQCRFCSYYRKQGQEQAFELSLEEIKEKIMAQSDMPLTEIHIVGGCHPGLGLDYYEAALSTIRALRPDVILKCFTPVEIEHFANLEGISPREVLLRLRQSGLDMMAGGGAEIFAPDVRRRICPEKISGQRWLEISGLAHSLGLKTNCTMLFGHLETVRDRLEHLELLRTQQDQTGGFVCFIPLPFQTKNNQLTGITSLTGIEELKTIAVCRLMLDNIPNIKSYWVMLGLKQAQAALFFGANDLDGTVVEEKIGHMAGADSPQVLTRKELEDMIRGCGLIPQERNGLFSPVQGGQ